MQGMSEREYAARAGLSRGAIQKAKAAGRLVLHADGSIDPDASDARRAAATDPSKQRRERATGAAEAEAGAERRALGRRRHAAGERPAAAARRRRDLPAGEDRQRGAEVAGAAAEAPEAEGRAGRPRPRRGAGVPARPRDPRRLGELAGPRRGADRGRARASSPPPCRRSSKPMSAPTSTSSPRDGSISDDG